MKHRLSGAVLICGALATVSTACQDSGNGPRELSVPQLQQVVARGTPCAIFDVNGPKVRQEYGVIPGAQLLSSADDYDVSTTLPQDKGHMLLFYCSSTWCTAAKHAAVRAQSAGYRDVNVLPAGIKGWKLAGKLTDAI